MFVTRVRRRSYANKRRTSTVTRYRKKPSRKVVRPAYRAVAPVKPPPPTLPPVLRRITDTRYVVSTVSPTFADGFNVARVTQARRYGHALRVPVQNYLTSRREFVSGLKVNFRFEVATTVGMRFCIDVLKIATDVEDDTIEVLDDEGTWTTDSVWYDSPSSHSVINPVLRESGVFFFVFLLIFVVDYVNSATYWHETIF